MDWVGYWNAAPTIYAGERHRRVHYETVADGIAALVAGPEDHVLDYGCGEALSADRVRARCGRLTLVDAAETVRRGLEARFADAPGIAVAAPEDLAALPPGSVDLVVANSVLQYLDEAAIAAAIEEWRRLLSPAGRIVLADVIPPDASALDDARALLSFAAANGFLGAALAGLARTALSDYRKLRRELGLGKFTERQIVDLMARHGLAAERIRPNLGHNQARMAFSVRPVPS